jgi:pyruvate,orthophosphate dikinase
MVRGAHESSVSPADVLVESGFAVRKRTTLMITAEGRERHARWARIEAGSASEVDLRLAYERFLPLNDELIRVCNDWQVHSGGPNDHTDVEYDWAVIDRLARIHERLGPVARSMTKSSERFGAYRGRLAAAFAKVEEGEADWFTSPRLDSYHTVWMQLHEDLLLGLGIERSDEART